MPVPVKKKLAATKSAAKAGATTKPQLQPKHTTAEGEKDVCWVYKELFDVFCIPHKEMENEAVVLNMIAAKLSYNDCTLLVRAIRVLKNAET